MSTKTYAKVVRRRTPTFPSRYAFYWDCTPWNGGFVRRHVMPGAVVLNTLGDMLDLHTGEIYQDERFRHAMAA
jgi:hypothetical protein